MSDYEAYKLFMGLRSHFYKNFDFIKYNGKIKFETYDSFKARSDSLLFAKLARHKDLKEYLIANFIKQDFWIKDLAFNEICEKNFVEWEKRKFSLTYTFKNDILHIEDLEDTIELKKNKHPKLLSLYLRKKICIETFIIIMNIMGLFDKWDVSLKNDVIWQSQSEILKKYNPFIQYDSDKLSKILFDHAKININTP